LDATVGRQSRLSAEDWDRQSQILTPSQQWNSTVQILTEETWLKSMSNTNDSQRFLHLITRRFKKESSPLDFERAMQVRIEVFVEEQNVPMEEELDDYDEDAIHWLMIAVTTANAEEVVATGRLVSYLEAGQTTPVAKIGRIAVKEGMRGLKVGDSLMRQILQVASQEGYEQAILDAQTRVLPFYEKLGFVTEGDEFLDVNIPHYRMRCQLDH
jgi:predicted GNAT family N-acyltransferase